ncbi:Hypothetical protein NGAL_HAMBI2605_09600 [Neorhizobium galegae bv. orientalis]|nr:Hypothetical protein NGAL_HAMBI2605_09600 [Neorhizobium galegae bv. orientalis]
MNNEWQKPVRFREDGLLITVATAAQARTWLSSARKGGRAWEEALDKCSAAAEGRLSNAEARKAFLKAAH